MVLKKIMVVDPDIVLSVKQYLEKSGDRYAVICADSSKQCLELLNKCHMPDLILLDIMMSGMSGWDVFNCIKKKNSDIKVAFMSVLEISDKRKQVLLDEGLADYIMKPFDKDTLLERVDNILKD